MLTIFSLVLLAAACLIVFVSNGPVAELPKEKECRYADVICLAMVVLGCVMRLMALGTLPAGLSPEEALVGVQGKALWQTGGFYPDGQLAAVLPQWSGEMNGPLLAVLTAPFVGLFGISALTVRLPLVLLSIAAIPAAYAVGCMLSGKKAGRFLMAVYALCPYFVLGARMTCGANAALFMLPIAAALLMAGLKRPALLYAGMAALAMTAYSQTMMLVIVPAAVIGAAAVALIHGKNRMHALLAAALGLVLCVPAILTVYVDLNGLESTTFLGLLEIPSENLFSKNLFVSLAAESNISGQMLRVLIKCWCTVVGGILQAVWHENISASLFMPDGMLALTVVSVPLILLGVGTLALRRIDGERAKPEVAGPRAMMAVLFAVAFTGVTLFGYDGYFNAGGAPGVFDHANLFFFAAVLMTAGWRYMQRRCMVGTRLLSGLLAVCVVWLGVHLFGGAYRENATTYFNSFAEACAYAGEIQEETGARVNVTTTVYPHVQPDAAAKVMYLYATNADMREEQNFTDMYAPGVEWVDPSEIYVAQVNDIAYWDWGDMNYEEFGDYLVISPYTE